MKLRNYVLLVSSNGSVHDDLNEDGPHRLIYLNVLVPVGGTVWEVMIRRPGLCCVIRDRRTL